MIVFALRYSVGAAGSALWKAVGRTDISFKLGIITAPLFLLAVWIGSFKGIVGAAIAVTVVRTLMGMIGFKYIGSCIGSNLCQV
jgi:Na+-driven multidrug efflux pump